MTAAPKKPTALYIDTEFGDPAIEDAKGAVGRITGGLGTFHGKPVDAEWGIQTNSATFFSLKVVSAKLDTSGPVPVATVHLCTPDEIINFDVKIEGRKISLLVLVEGEEETIPVYSASGTPVPADGTVNYQPV